MMARCGVTTSASSCEPVSASVRCSPVSFAGQPNKRLKLAALMTPLMLLRPWIFGMLTFAIAGCGCSDIPASVEAEFVQPQGTVLQVGDTATIRARVLNSGDIVCVRYASLAGYGGPIRPDRFTYESSRRDVATVSNQGLVTALQPGITNIRVSAEGLASSPISVTVEAQPAVSVAPHQWVAAMAFAVAQRRLTSA
jgi:Big-like domain-containing protein